MDWLKRMNSVLDYIENNLDGEIKDSEIATLSANSKGMFQRIFAVITDMTLSEYIRKRRLTQAASDIQSTDAKIIDIAVKYGYNSATSFSAAFKNFHGIKPSDAKKSDIQFQSFQRLTFKLTLSVKGGNDMQYRVIENIENIKNAEEILQKMTGKDWLKDVSEHNGAKCACDGCRVAVILPEGTDDWDLCDAYIETGNETTPRFELTRIFTTRNNNGFSFKMPKRQFEIFKTKIDSANDNFICVDINAMEIITKEAALEVKDKSESRIISFNIKYLREAFNFIMCSGDEYIEIYYNGNADALILKSSRLYAAVLPIRLQ
ncbi:MAG: helix-turn-helix domain-containing protein [Oscillospiraceae bacterium]|nr:helix-turn-helix domain-containing protein [Oscillospiraceae bacterium]